MKRKIKLSILILCITLVLGSCGVTGDSPNESTQVSTSLAKSEDQGQDYIDSFIFIGESTTAHLKSRGVLSGSKNTKQVWANSSGTMNMSLSIDKERIIYPETGEKLTFYEAAQKRKPEYVIITFGLNGAVQNITKGKEYYKTCYKKLINAIREGSPNTKIILQSAFPVAENMNMSSYSVSLFELNRYIDTINSWTEELAGEENCKYLATNEILKDENNNLKMEYQVGDGCHLTAEAYRQILSYIRTHPYL